MGTLVERIHECRGSGNRDAWLDVVEEVACFYTPQLRAYVIRRAPAADADDVFQEVLIAIGQGLLSFSGQTDASLRAWCYRIASNKCADALRRRAADRSIQIDREALWQVIEASAADEPLSPGDRIDLKEAIDLLEAVKPSSSDFLWKRYVLGLDYQEIAAEYGISYDNARMRVNHCLELAQELMRQSR